MPNLVGIGLSQVPTNSMLGGMAYQDPDRVKIKKLNVDEISQINSEIADTATDIFIYDTSKDSDGGAWRKRTSHTSWYNETLGTATRGTRREFPAVAVIVIESEHLKIYDGDDPSLPMWMVFEHGVKHILGCNGDNLWSVVALNGIIVVGENESYGGVVQIKFISDTAVRLRGTLTTNGTNGRWLGNIQERNDGYGDARGYDNESSYDRLVADNAQDVSVTVLPNAQVDEITGLPVPTIAVATAGGVSVIKDDGSVVDITASAGSNYHNADFISIANDEFLVFPQHGAGSGGEYSLMTIPIPDSDRTTQTNSGNASDKFIYNDTNAALTNLPHGLGVNQNGALRIPGTQFLNYPNGLAILSEKPSSLGDAMVNYITKDYNTGWMQGNIKGAFLSDTDTTNATYSTVADDWATTGSWTKQSSITISSTGSGTSGTLSITGNGTGSNVYFFNGISVEANTDYVMTVNFGAYNANEFYINNTTYSTANKLLDINALSGSTRGGYFNSGSSTTLYIQGYQVSGTATTINYITIQKVSEKDRSVNNKGLQVFGLVTKSAVATGADLIAYSNFSASNHFRQPPNSDMNIGTSDAYEMIWFKTTNTSGTMMMISYEGGAIGTNDYGKPFNIRYENGSVRGWASHNAFSTFDDVNHGVSTANGSWHHAAWVKRGQVFELYVDGEFIGSDTGSVGSNALSDANSELVIGARKRGKVPGDSEEPWNNGSLALARFGKSAPSAEQIKKIYEDEKVLFQENAACTLYGSSDDVKALAYDESTEQLHVGTSSGRSDFQGLRRINNTTTAVTTAISAHDGFIVEQ